MDVAAMTEPKLIQGMTYAQYDDIVTRLMNIEDPELGVNIVDLGLVYDMNLEGDTLKLDMTLTYAGCPFTEALSDDVNDALLGTGLNAEIKWVFMPPWDFSRLTDEGREQLRSLGALL
jgi:metal-sulfur cluster biosynthetic enzyme